MSGSITDFKIKPEKAESEKNIDMFFLYKISNLLDNLLNRMTCRIVAKIFIIFGILLVETTASKAAVYVDYSVLNRFNDHLLAIDPLIIPTNDNPIKRKTTGKGVGRDLREIAGKLNNKILILVLDIDGTVVSQPDPESSPEQRIRFRRKQTNMLKKLKAQLSSDVILIFNTSRDYTKVSDWELSLDREGLPVPDFLIFGNGREVRARKTLPLFLSHLNVTDLLLQTKKLDAVYREHERQAFGSMNPYRRIEYVDAVGAAMEQGSIVMTLTSTTFWQRLRYPGEHLRLWLRHMAVYQPSMAYVDLHQTDAGYFFDGVVNKGTAALMVIDRVMSVTDREYMVVTSGDALDDVFMVLLDRLPQVYTSPELPAGPFELPELGLSWPQIADVLRNWHVGILPYQYSQVVEEHLSATGLIHHPRLRIARTPGISGILQELNHSL